MCYREIWLRIKELEGTGWQKCHVNEMSMVIWEGGHEQRIKGGKGVNPMDVWKKPTPGKDPAVGACSGQLQDAMVRCKCPLQ